MRAKDNAPIIIKRKKVIAGGGHHGGAWKVAYADFVTAMMAFFMLMWLLNATTETQRKGLADYFSPTIPVNRISGGGDGAFGGDSVFAEESLAQNGTGGSANNPGEAAAVSESSGADSSGQDKGSDDQAFADIESVLAAQSGESMVSTMMQRHIITKVTDEGLIVELFDLPDEPLFFDGTAEPTAIMADLVAMLAQVFGVVANQVAISGHVRAHPLVYRTNPVWPLSNTRADEIRQMFARQQLAEDRIERVTGFANRKPVSANPMSIRNNRFEIILLRNIDSGGQPVKL